MPTAGVLGVTRSALRRALRGYRRLGCMAHAQLRKQLLRWRDPVLFGGWSASAHELSSQNAPDPYLHPDRDLESKASPQRAAVLKGDVPAPGGAAAGGDACITPGGGCSCDAAPAARPSSSAACGTPPSASPRQPHDAAFIDAQSRLAAAASTSTSPAASPAPPLLATAPAATAPLLARPGTAPSAAATPSPPASPSPRGAPTLVLLGEAILSHTLPVLWGAIFLNHAVNGNLLSLPLPLSLLLYAALELPRPATGYLHLLTAYVSAVILLKYLYQLPLFCASPPLSFRSTQRLFGLDTPLAVCEDPQVASVATDTFQPTLPSRVDYLLGLHKYTGYASLPEDQGLLVGLLPDLLLLALLLLHTRLTRARGAVTPRDVPRGAASATRLAAEERRAASRVDGRCGHERARALRLRAALRRFAMRLLPPRRLAKPGRNLQTSSFVVCLLLLVYIFLFFSALAPFATASCASNSIQEQLSTSQFDSSSVLALFLCILVMVLDRIVYRCWAPPAPQLADAAASADVASAAAATAATATAPSPSGRSGERARLASTVGYLVAPGIKLAMHAALSIALHCAAFFTLSGWVCNSACDPLPGDGEAYCARSWYLFCFYLLACCYLYVSAAQLREGLPRVSLDSGTQASLYLYTLYMAVPFLWEMQVALDWTVEPTSLSLFQWLTIEDIHAGLCSVRQDMNFRRQRVRGAKQPLGTKIGVGCCSVLALLLILLGPLYLFSGASPISSANPITSARLRLFLAPPAGAQGLGGAFELGSIGRYSLTQLSASDPLLSTHFSLYSCQKAVNATDSKEADKVCGYSYLFSPDWSVDWWSLTFAAAAQQSWSINWASLEELRLALNTSLDIGVEVSFERALSSEVVLALRRPLREAQRLLLLHVTDDAHANESVSINLTAFFPKLIRLPSVGNAKPIALTGSREDDWHTKQALQLTRSSRAGDQRVAAEQWWALAQPTDEVGPFYASAGSGLRLVVASDRVAGGSVGSSSATSFIVAGGVAVFYYVVVFGIWRATRGFLGGKRYKIALDEFPDSRDLVDLCDGLHIARRQRQLLRENELYETIIRLYRSPETLLRLTGDELKRD